MERKIGEIFEYNGEWYQCVESDSCGECSLFTTECGSGTKSNLADKIFGECSRVRRSDNKHAIFKKLEKVGEPKIINGKKVQLLKSKYCKNCAFWDNNDCTFTTYPRTCMGGEYGVYVEIKQNKEDMSNTETLWYGPDKKEAKSLELSNLKPFSLEAAKAGKPVCTRDGRKARIICFDRISGDDYYKIVACVTAFDGDFEEVLSYGIDGYIVDSQNPKDEDLMMLPEKKEGWINVYKERCYETKEEAIRHIAPGTHYIDTIRVEWEDKE